MAQTKPQSNVDRALDSIASGIADAGRRTTGTTPGSLGFNAADNGATSKDVLYVAAAQTTLLKGYYADVLSQSNRSFLMAMVGATVGFIIFIASVYLLLTKQYTDIATVSTIASLIIEVISGLLFYLYARTSTQLSSFHVRLLRVQRYLLANRICDTIANDTARDTSRAELVKAIASATADADVPNAPLPTGKLAGG